MRTLYFYHDIEEQYEEMLNDCYPEVDICGHKYAPGHALKMIDEVAFNVGCSEWSDDEFVEVSFEDMTEAEREHYGAYNSTLMYCTVDEVGDIEEDDDENGTDTGECHGYQGD